MNAQRDSQSWATADDWINAASSTSEAVSNGHLFTSRSSNRSTSSSVHRARYATECANEQAGDQIAATAQAADSHRTAHQAAQKRCSAQEFHQNLTIHHAPPTHLHSQCPSASMARSLRPKTSTGTSVVQPRSSARISPSTSPLQPTSIPSAQAHRWQDHRTQGHQLELSPSSTASLGILATSRLVHPRLDGSLGQCVAVRRIAMARDLPVIPE